MKLSKKHIGTFLVSFAILLVFGNTAFANVSFSEKVKFSEVSYLQTDDGGKSIVFDEFSIGKVSQTVSQNEYLGLGFVGTFYPNRDFFHTQASSLFNCSYSLEDKRKLIFQYLYPFHFFW